MNETEPNTQSDPIQGPPSPENHRRPKRLVRPANGRVVAGVAVGLARFLGVPLWLVRLLFVLLIFAAGTGLALYILGWLLIPDERDRQSIAEDLIDRFRGGDRGWIGIALIVVALLILFDGWLGSRLIWAIGFGVVGYLLYTGHLNLGGSSGEPPPGSGPPQGSPDPEPVPPVPNEPEPRGLGPPTPSESEPPQPSETTSALDHQEGELLHTAEHPEPESRSTGVWDEDLPSTDLPPPSRRRRRSLLGRLTLAVVLVTVAFMGALMLLDVIAFAPGHLWAVALGLIGLGLLVGTFVGRARWLILVGVLLTPLALAAPVGSFSIEGEELSIAAGEYSVSPTHFTNLGPGISREMTAGRIHYDLTGLPWNGETLNLDLALGFGSIELAVPENVAVEADLAVGVGVIETDEGDDAGYNVEQAWNLLGTDGTIRVDARVGGGTIEVDQVAPTETREGSR